MHSSHAEDEFSRKNGGEVLLTIATLITESRIPVASAVKLKHCPALLFEGPHCIGSENSKNHKCITTDNLCIEYANIRDQVSDLSKNNIPFCVEVILTCSCDGGDLEARTYGLLLEKWYLHITHRRNTDTALFRTAELINAIRSELYYSQLTSWMKQKDEKGAALYQINRKNLHYCVTIPGETYESTKFTLPCVKNSFPLTDIGNGYILNASWEHLKSLPEMPDLSCATCEKGNRGCPQQCSTEESTDLSSVTSKSKKGCTLNRKHCCDNYEDCDVVEDQSDVDFYPELYKNPTKTSRKCTSFDEPSTSNIFNDITIAESCTQLNTFTCHDKKKNKNNDGKESHSTSPCVSSDSILESPKSTQRKCDKNVLHNLPEKCDISVESSSSTERTSDVTLMRTDNIQQKQLSQICSTAKKHHLIRRLTFDDNATVTNKNDCDKQTKTERDLEIPSALEQAKFRKEFDHAASMVFHARTGLPLTSSPAPIRRGKSCFDFDSTINSVSAIKRALFLTSSIEDDQDTENTVLSPCSPETASLLKGDISPVKTRSKGHGANLLGSFEESVLNGRLEPASTVHGFTAELGASGSFVPKHITLPVTVFFYTLGDSDKVSSPYLGHINLGRKGYNIPKSGTLQVTLFNPLGTVVKMFVIMYDLSDMPPNSQTFIRQRTIYMPINCKDYTDEEWGPKWLRYLIHLRVMSSKSGKVYLHSDVRMIVFRKSDMDTATAHGRDMSYELRSFTHMPINPRFSPRK